MSLNAIATPAALEPGPLVTRCRSLTVAKVDSIVIWSSPAVVFDVQQGPVSPLSPVVDVVISGPSITGIDRRFEVAGAKSGSTGVTSGVVDGARRGRRTGHTDRAVSVVSECDRAVAEHGEGLRPRPEGLLRVLGPPRVGLARGPTGGHRRVRRLAAAPCGGSSGPGGGAPLERAAGRRGHDQPEAVGGQLVLPASGATRRRLG